MSFPTQPSRSECLFLDVDGTLIDIAPTPDAVVVPPGLVETLLRLETYFGGALALVSGRSIDSLDALFQPARFAASGAHGAEFRLCEDRGRRWSVAAPLPGAVWTDVLDLLERFPGTLAENKGFSVAVHYRAAPDCRPRLEEALNRFREARPSLAIEILPGHRVFELKQPGVDKGAAIRALLAHHPFAGRAPIFLGDDVTDAAGFSAVADCGGRAYSVGRVFPDVAGTFADPAAVRDWLARIGEMEVAR